jgi:hypothetical protein
MEVFWTRHDLSVIDALGIDHPIATAVATNLLDRTTDGYAARDILAHPSCHHLAGRRQRHRLLAVISGCRLNLGQIEPNYLKMINRLLDATDSAIHHPPKPITPPDSLTRATAR